MSTGCSPHTRGGRSGFVRISPRRRLSARWARLQDQGPMVERAVQLAVLACLFGGGAFQTTCAERRPARPTPSRGCGMSGTSVMAQHPLARCAERIDPEAVYTVGGIARLLGMSVSSVKGMAGYGWLPGGSMQPHARGGRQHVWAGARLLQLAQEPLVVEYDHERHSPVTLYRVGCRCDVCAQALQRRRRRSGVLRPRRPFLHSPGTDCWSRSPAARRWPRLQRRSG